MLEFETVNELALKVNAQGNEILFTRTGAFISGECPGGRNFSFEKALIGPEQNIGEALFGQLKRRITKENISLTKVSFNGPSETYYANSGHHVITYELRPGEVIVVESENLLAFTSMCKYDIKLVGQNVFKQGGIVMTSLTGLGPGAYVAVTSDGNPLIYSNMKDGHSMYTDPDATICWIGALGQSDPTIDLNNDWKLVIGQASGETYMFEWGAGRRATVLVQPTERDSSIDITMD